MPKSPHAAYLDQVIAGLVADFKAAGFRKRGATFNRRRNDLVHVVNFQMDRWNAHRSEPGFDPNNPGGRFTVNLGVYVPDVDVVTRGGAETGWIAEMLCHVRERLGALVKDRDHWWTMTGPHETLTAELRDHFASSGLPWLDSIGSVDEFIERWPELLPAVSPDVYEWWSVRVALVRALRGDVDTARPVVEAALEGMEAGSRAAICAWAKRAGLTRLRGCP